MISWGVGDSAPPSIAPPRYRASGVLRQSGVRPNVGGACHICRIRSRTSWASAGRPGVPRWRKRRQCARKRLGCQAITMRGCTHGTTLYQPGHRCDSHAQHTRSDGRSRGRPTVCRETAPGCWSAKIFRGIAWRAWKKVTTKANRAESTGGIVKALMEIKYQEQHRSVGHECAQEPVMSSMTPDLGFREGHHGTTSSHRW